MIGTHARNPYVDNETACGKTLRFVRIEDEILIATCGGCLEKLAQWRADDEPPPQPEQMELAL